MKTIEQQVTVKFHAVEAQDIITMLPVIDNLIEAFHQLCIDFDVQTGDSNASQEYFLTIAKRAVEKWNQIKCLHKLGFMSSLRQDLQNYEALTIAYFYGLGDEVQICMQNGYTPAQALAEVNIL